MKWMHYFVRETYQNIKLIETSSQNVSHSTLLFVDDLLYIVYSFDSYFLLVMQLWDDLCQHNTHYKIIVIGSTNRPQDLDPAIQRRFERTFLIANPDERQRKLIFYKLLKNIQKENGFDYQSLAQLTEGYCSNDILNICKEAILIPIREMKRRKTSSLTELSDLNESVANLIRPLTSNVSGSFVCFCVIPVSFVW
jgi:transitional endoplasmic reticulum ATPase